MKIKDIFNDHRHNSAGTFWSGQKQFFNEEFVLDMMQQAAEAADKGQIMLLHNLTDFEVRLYQEKQIRTLKSGLKKALARNEELKADWVDLDGLNTTGIRSHLKDVLVSLRAKKEDNERLAAQNKKLISEMYLLRTKKTA